MPRLNVVDPAQAEGKAKELFEGPLKGKHLNLFKGMANSGAALEAYVSFSGALSKGLLSPAEREIVALTLAQSNGCDYCAAAHTAIAKSIGMSEDDTIAARVGTLNDPKLLAIHNFTINLRERQGAVTDDELAAIKSAGYNDGHIAEVVACYALNIFTNYFNLMNQTDVDFPAAPSLD